MDTRMVLLPIDVNVVFPGAFEVVNRLSWHSQLTVTLLHVVTLNVMTLGTRVYEELTAEADSYLEALSREYIRPGVDTFRRVRRGRVPDEILAHAASAPPDLILLPVRRPIPQSASWIRGLRGPTASLSRTVQTLLLEAPCDVLVMPMTEHFSCDKIWGPSLMALGSGREGPAVG